MSAPSESATSPSPCACTNISLMQLFHELKQKFPGVPDHVVSNTIELYCHDKQACETHLHSEAKASLTHAYHASSSAAARQLNELKVNLPGRCRNQAIVKHEAAKSTAVHSITCQAPQTAVLSTAIITDEFDQDTNVIDKNPNTDDNQNVVEPIKAESERKNSNTSPVTVINIDNCHAKYSGESPSDLELTNENTKDEKASIPQAINEQPESTNYRILKSNKVKCNLHEKLEKVKEKKTIKKAETQHEKSPDKKVDIPQEKPVRPNTLNFIKPNPDIAFKPTLKEPLNEPCRTVSPAPIKQELPPKENLDKEKQFRPERGYPLNVSVNVNCHMDLSRGYEPWFEDYSSPRAITSVNLTVCTPTSNMASPVREPREDDGGFEGHVTVTVSPSTARAPRRPAPPPPGRPTRLESPRPTRAAPEPPGSTIDRALIERQKERLGRLAAALAQERSRLAQLTRETQILEAPPPPPRAATNLREYVEQLRDKCDTLAKRLEMGGDSDQQDSDNFYSNIYTGQRPPQSWQCHMCTFRNHPLLDKCEECGMPRIFVGTSPSRTHDSGFGSFRDRNRKISKDDTAVDFVMVPNVVEDRCALPKLNC